MNHRPKLRHPALLLPNIPGHDEELWEALMQLARVKSLQEWSLIGGQMVLLHALEYGVRPIRISSDIDVLVNVRTVDGRCLPLLRRPHSLRARQSLTIGRASPQTPGVTESSPKIQRAGRGL